ncbi:unnamed protein product [Allacma fusca]|uniref:Transmembrane protein n=1 Tax=Allacma fusca TaxID=39272 RepID=A0A8J2JB92_9HEXA|nr:unnamed protein product [Allacma fusca]
MQEQSINETIPTLVRNTEKGKELEVIEQNGDNFETKSTGLLGSLERGEDAVIKSLQCKRKQYCQPCGCCGISLERGALIGAVIFVVLGGIFTITSIAFVVLTDQWKWSGRLFFVILFFVVCSLMWLAASLILIVGVTIRSTCLIRTFLWMILIIPVIMLLLGIFYTMITLAEGNHCLSSVEMLRLLQTLYFAPLVLGLLLWYFYWVVYSFYIKCGGRSCCRCHCSI